MLGPAMVSLGVAPALWAVSGIRILRAARSAGRPEGVHWVQHLVGMSAWTRIGGAWLFRMVGPPLRRGRQSDLLNRLVE